MYGGRETGQTSTDRSVTLLDSPRLLLTFECSVVSKHKGIGQQGQNQ
jgi:hypothetical protein